MAHRATVLGLRERNRASVLRHVLLNQPTTRADIAVACDLSTSTVTNVVGALIREGLVQENGSVPSDGGRPIAQICPAPDGAHVIGVDVGEQGISVELFDLSLSRLDRVFRALPRRASKPGRVGQVVSDAVDAIRTANPDVEETLIGIGLGLPGIVALDPVGGVTLYAQSVGWEPTSVDEMFASLGLRTFADNGAKTLARAEMWFGAARGVKHGVVALVGRGLGAGVISDGKLLRGLSSSAGEWGHTKIAVNGRVCQCGGHGCLEAYAGGGAIMNRWHEAGGASNGPLEQGLEKLIQAANGGDPTAEQVLAETVDSLGVGLANLVNLFNPEQIVIGGWAGLRLFEARGEQITRRLRADALARPAEQCRIEACRFGDDAVALGAALLPIESLIDGSILSPGISK